MVLFQNYKKEKVGDMIQSLSHQNTKKTFAESNNKNKLSHRYKALKKFSNWYLHK